jgi:hypothetical protein
MRRHHLQPTYPARPGPDLLNDAAAAFAALAGDLCGLHDTWQLSGASAEALAWSERLACYAAWWGGRLEGQSQLRTPGRCLRRALPGIGQDPPRGLDG